MHITYSMVRDDLPAIIATKGEDFKYVFPPGGTCLYVENGAPSCLIGHYLIDLGFPMDAFQAVEGNGIESLFHEENFKEIMTSHGFTAEPDAIMALSRLQGIQDNGYSWGYAYNLTFDSEQ